MGHDDLLQPIHLPNELRKDTSLSYQDQKTGSPLRRIMEETEKENIMRALQYYKGNKRKTALHLGIQRSALYLKLKKYNLL